MRLGQVNFVKFELNFDCLGATG